MELKNVCYAALGACIDELIKRAGLTNEDVYHTLKIGHDTLNDIKKG